MSLLRSITSLIAVWITPALTFAQDGVVPCSGPDCTFDDVLTLVNNLIEFALFYLAMPIAAVMFVFAGWLYMASGGDSTKVKKAHKVFVTVVVGFVVALAAWLIVDLIVTGLVDDPSQTGGQFLEE